MKGKKDGLLAYGVLLLCLSFALGYLLGHGSGETEIQVISAPSSVVEIAKDSLSFSAEKESVVPSETAPINLNTATQSELEQLPGIGPELAGRIIAYRKQHGSFVSKEQIMDVKGIGEKRYMDMEGLITIGGAQ